MSWFKEDAYSDDNLRGAKEKSKRVGWQAKRFWMPPGAEKKLLFLDDSPPAIEEHNPMINGTFRDNQYTCRLDYDENDPTCFFCDEGIRSYYVGFWTVIEITELEWKGKTYKNFRRLLAAKQKMVEYFKTKRRRANEKAAMEGKPQTGLAGKVFIVDRTSSKDASIGNNYEMVGSEPFVRDEESGLMVVANKEYWYPRKSRDERTGEEKTVLRPPLPFRYQDLLAPRSNGELRAIMARDGKGSWEDEGRTLEPGKEVPF